MILPAYPAISLTHPSKLKFIVVLKDRKSSIRCSRSRLLAIKTSVKVQGHVPDFIK